MFTDFGITSRPGRFSRTDAIVPVEPTEHHRLSEEVTTASMPLGIESGRESIRVGRRYGS
jgi:hypothetical protein